MRSSNPSPGDIEPSEDTVIEALSNIPNYLPVAQWPGELESGIAVYVLSDGKRIISRTGATDFLTAGKGGGNLESYTGIQALKKYIPDDLPGQMGGVRHARGR